MCGIAGIFRVDGQPVSHRTIRKMTDALAHRGPDGEGHFVDKNLALGHRRLAVIDLTSLAQQPMSNTEGNVIVVYNGEIYNHPELRAELIAKGHRFHSRSDTEVLIHGYEEEGIHFVERLNGMFAFALFDKVKRELYLCRDRYGVKPLYFYVRNNLLLFASEIKALLAHPEVSPRLNYDALNEYFTFQNLFRYHTLFENIHLLPAASIRRISERDPVLKRETWWDFDFSRPDESMSREEAEEETLRLFKQAVVRQLISDVQVGSYLSGGIDSGSVVAVASSEIERLKTFTCGFHMHSVHGVEANYDERAEAEIIANRFKTEHYEQVVSSGDLSWALPHVVWHLEDLRIGMSYPQFYISRLASKFVKVCLAGAGGDELFGGYPWRYYRVFRALSRDEYFREYYNYWQRLVTDEEKPQLFTQETMSKVKNTTDPFRTFSRVFTFNDNLRYDTPEEHIANSLYFEIKTFLHGLFIVNDKLSMANALEERVPFLDNDLVDFAQKIPVRHKLANLRAMKRMDENEQKKVRRYQEYNEGKNVFRNAVKKMLPQAAVSRKKQGFSAPDESWYRNDNIAYLKKTLLNKRAASRDIINPHYVERILEEHVERRQNKRLLLWSLLCFEQWCALFLENRTVESLIESPRNLC